MCRTFKVSASGYYAWRSRPMCPRKQEDAQLRELIVAIHARSRGTLDRELLDGAVFINRAAARLAVFNYIESWFNPWRRHSSIGMLSPAQFERAWREKNDQEVMA